MLYDNYLQHLMSIYSSEMEKIKAGYNFDYGVEYEIALCKVLRLILPNKFGVCRGYAVDSNGNQAGDDIIIYDQHQYPTLGLREGSDSYSRKEFIAIESIYGYIEAKHTIHLYGNDGQSLSKSLSQVQNVKALCSKRKRVELNETKDLKYGHSIVGPNDYPNFRNPPWGAIFARNVLNKKGGEEVSSSARVRELGNLAGVPVHGPDLFVFGENIISVPVLRQDGIDTLCHFEIPQRTQWLMRGASSCAPAAGIAMLLGALDWILLGRFRWDALVIDAMEKPIKRT